jgi:hypothetical protein
MKRFLILAFLSLSILSFDWGFPPEMWKPVNTALGFYYSMITPKYNYIAWDLITDNWKAWDGLERDTFVSQYIEVQPNDRRIIDIQAGMLYSPDYYRVILVTHGGTGYTLCVKDNKGHWEIDCIWYE